MTEYDATPAGCTLQYTLYGSPDSMLLLLLVLGAHYGCCVAVWDTPLAHSPSYMPPPPPPTSEQCASTVSPSSYQPQRHHHSHYDPLSALFHMAELLTSDTPPPPPPASVGTTTAMPGTSSATYKTQWETAASDDTPIIGIFLYCLASFTILWMPSLYIPYPAQRYRLHAVNQVLTLTLFVHICLYLMRCSIYLCAV
jgi:hypothetical protein